MFRNISFEPRHLVDPRELRALAHPVRLALLEALAEHGPLTATSAAEHVGESPSSCSWHLRQLAKFGFVEEAGEASGRRRPWRLTAHGLRFTVDGTQDPETLAAGRALERLFADRYLARAERGLSARPDLPPEWQRATGTSQFVLHVTAAGAGGAAGGGHRRADALPRPRRRAGSSPARRPHDRGARARLPARRCVSCWASATPASTWAARSARCSATARCCSCWPSGSSS